MIDFDEALEALEGDKELLEDCLVLLAQDLPERIEELSIALGKRDLNKIANVAHTIKGSVAVVGAKELQNTALAIEVSARQEDLLKVEAHYQSLCRQWRSLEKFLHSENLI